MKKVILASASPRRSELLQQAGIPFEVMVSRCEEQIETKVPEQVVTGLSMRKARAVSSAFPGEVLIIGADTIVVREGKILGKPKDEAEAFSMLKSLQGRTHQVYTGVALLGKSREGIFEKSFYEVTDVTMYPMEDWEIREYLSTGEPMDKAGAYGIQGRAGIYVKEIHGDYNNVVGLPIARLYQEIRNWLYEADSAHNG